MLWRVSHRAPLLKEFTGHYWLQISWIYTVYKLIYMGIGLIKTTFMKKVVLSAVQLRCSADGEQFLVHKKGTRWGCPPHNLLEIPPLPSQREINIEHTLKQSYGRQIIFLLLFGHTYILNRLGPPQIPALMGFCLA